LKASDFAYQVQTKLAEMGHHIHDCNGELSLYSHIGMLNQHKGMDYLLSKGVDNIAKE